MDLRLKGPRNIVLQKASDSAAVEKAKSEIVSQIKALAPWKDWDIDVMLSSSDENSISKAWPFNRVEVLPSENRTMTGPVNLNVAFIDAGGRTSSKCALNPTILRKVEVVVLNANCRQGQILSETMLKRVPMWLGPEGKDCMTDYNACVGRELARTMSTGDIVKANDILNPVCAKRGDMIWVECRDHGLSVKLAVTAMESGRQGDLIKVVNQPTQRTFLVLLVGERQALYKMGS
jgi:flagella basal body P-ring formation protein FlgA